MPRNAVTELLKDVQEAFGRFASKRNSFVLQSLVEHLHRFVDEVELTREEWLRAIEFLTAVGQACTPTRQEFMLLSDVLGVSTAVEMVNEHIGATPGTVLGPFHVADSPPRKNGESMIDSPDEGQRLRISGVVRSQDGSPIPHATIDVWSCASNGLYPAQDDTQEATNMRGVIRADAGGHYEFIVVRPTNYSIPMDGPVGRFMLASQRSPMRAAHVHLIISAPGFSGVTTHLFDRDCTFLATDSVFSTRSELIREFHGGSNGELTVQFDVTLASAAPLSDR